MVQPLLKREVEPLIIVRIVRETKKSLPVKHHRSGNISSSGSTLSLKSRKGRVKFATFKEHKRLVGN